MFCHDFGASQAKIPPKQPYFKTLHPKLKHGAIDNQSNKLAE